MLVQVGYSTTPKNCNCSSIQTISSFPFKNQSHIFIHFSFSFGVFRIQISHYTASLNVKSDFIPFAESCVNVR